MGDAALYRDLLNSCPLEGILRKTHESLDEILWERGIELPPADAGAEEAFLRRQEDAREHPCAVAATAHARGRRRVVRGGWPAPSSVPASTWGKSKPEPCDCVRRGPIAGDPQRPAANASVARGLWTIRCSSLGASARFSDPRRDGDLAA